MPERTRPQQLKDCCLILTEKDWRSRKVKESLVIRQARNFNRDVDVDLKGSWRGIFNCFRLDGF